MAWARAIVVGGGIIGTSVAYFLAREGLEVFLLERSRLGDGASGACEGLLLVQSKKPGLHLLMALRSIAMYPQLIEDIGVDVEWERRGALFVATEAADLEGLVELARQQQAAGIEAVILDREEVLRAEPALGSCVCGGCLTVDDAQLNPFKVIYGLAQALVRMGGRVWVGCEVEGVRVCGDRVTGVYTSRGVLGADLVVNAAGVAAAGLVRRLGITLPIRPRRGQVMVTEAVAPLIRRPVVEAAYARLKFSRGAEGTPRVSLVLEQTRRGNLLLGSTREFVGCDRRSTHQGASAIARRATLILPSLSRASIIRIYAGLRPHTPDGLPIIDWVGPQGLVVAAGHEGDGVTLAPLTGRLVADLVTGRRPAVPMDRLRADRFSHT